MRPKPNFKKWIYIAAATALFIPTAAFAMGVSPDKASEGADTGASVTGDSDVNTDAKPGIEVKSDTADRVTPSIETRGGSRSDVQLGEDDNVPYRSGRNHHH